MIPRLKQSRDNSDLPIVLPSLPAEWVWTNVRQLAQSGELAVLTGPFGSTLGSEDFVAEGVPLLTIGCLTESGISLEKAFYISSKKAAELSRYQVRPGDLLFSRSASVGRAGLVSDVLDGSVINYHLMRLRLDSSILDPRLFIYFVRGSNVVRSYLREAIHGATRDGINTTDLLGMPVAVPPRTAQHRIVAKIEELFSDLDAGVAALERAKANLKRYRAAVLKAAVEGKLTEQWRAEHPNTEPASKLLARILAGRRKKWEADQLARFGAAGKPPARDWREKLVEPSPPDTVGLPELPEGWCWASVEQLGQVQLGRQRSPKNRSNKFPTKYIRAANITELGLNFTDVLDMEFRPSELETYRLYAGDILLSEASGSPDQVGKPVVWNGEIEDCCFQNTVIRLRPTGMPFDFPLTVFRHFYMNKLFAKVAAGVGINHLSASKFSALPFPLLPLAEQKEIAANVEARLSTIAESVRQIEVSLLRAARLRQSILKQAFERKLVPQDPHDEPARVQLDRILEQRSNADSRLSCNGQQSRNRKSRRRKMA